MASDEALKTASYLYKLFNSDSIIPLQAVAEFVRMLPGFQPAFTGEFLTEWKKMTAAGSPETGRCRDITAPLILTRGAGGREDGESLKFYFPEEKILINRTIFRQKLEGVDFSKTNQQAEKRLLDELKNEAIGLTDQEVLIYYNLLKIDILARSVSATPSAGLQPDETIVSSDVTIIGQGPFDYPEKLIEIIERNFVPLDKLAMINDRKPLDRQGLLEALSCKFSKSVHNPRVYCLLAGYEIEKYALFIRDYLGMIASRWGGSQEELLSYYAAYQLLSSSKPEIIDNLQLSVSLRNFVSDKLGRIHPVFYCAILFVTVFTYILVMQVMEISGKYFSMPEGQREKLMKLYDSEERLNMLVNNAFNIASGKIASFKAESREIIPSMKKYLGKNSGIILSSDMFKTRYNF